MGVVNERELRCLALRRSGQHAILNWIIKQAEGRIEFINNIDPTKALCASKDRLRSIASDRKDLLIYNYEDRYLEAVCQTAYAKNHDEIFGTSGVCWDVIILRDPFNLLASRLKSGIGRGIYSMNPKATMSLWAAHAAYFVGAPSPEQSYPLLCVNYNRWVRSRRYRELLCRRLQIPFTDDGKEEVTTGIRGALRAEWSPSSFDGAAYDGSASAMPVFSRWKGFTGRREFNEAITSKVYDLYTRIFQPIPGVEAFLG